MSLAGLAGETLPAPPFLGLGGSPNPNPPSPTTCCFGAAVPLGPEEDGGEGGFASLVAFAAVSVAVAFAAVASAAVVVAAALDATADAIALAALARLAASSFSVVVEAMAASSSLRTRWACCRWMREERERR